MYEFYGFDPKTLSNEELFDKHLALISKKLIAARYGKVDAVNQLQMMITAIEFERRERMFNELFGAPTIASSPVVIETDVELQKPVTEPSTKTVKPERLRRAIRTTKPVTTS